MINKFRAWDKKRNIMVPIDTERLGQYLTSKNFVCMQFTGINDKNGKEICEGDLLKISVDGIVQAKPFIVENLWDLRIGMQDSDSYMRIDDGEIIGNIYVRRTRITR